jgi:hypothetical protein
LKEMISFGEREMVEDPSGFDVVKKLLEKEI